MTTMVLFANPTAQTGRAAALIERARGLLDAAGVPHDFVATAPAGGAIALAAS